MLIWQFCMKVVSEEASNAVATTLRSETVESVVDIFHYTPTAVAQR